MPRQFFRKISPSRQRVREQRWLRPFRHLLDQPDLWAIRRRSVAPAVAVGLFWSWIPIPVHSVAAGLSALTLRVHMPTAIVMTLIVNPLTVLPIYYVGFSLGQRLLGTGPLPESGWNAALLAEQFGSIWPTLLLGNTIMGLVSALLGYLSVEALWRTRIGTYLSDRRRRRQRR